MYSIGSLVAVTLSVLALVFGNLALAVVLSMVALFALGHAVDIKVKRLRAAKRRRQAARRRQLRQRFVW